MNRIVTAALAVFGLIAVAAPAFAQPYPNRTVTANTPRSKASKFVFDPTV